MSFPASQFRNFAVFAAQTADAKKASDIRVLDLRRTRSGHADFILISSANSHVHMKTLIDAIEASLEQAGLSPVHKEGLRSSQWAALDYGGFLAHVFLEGARDFYSLERLWPDAKEITWEPGARKPARKKAKRKRKAARG